MTDLTSSKFTNPEAARKHLEAIRWPDGPVCPHCGVLEKASRIKGGRKGLLFCNACRKQYTVTVGTVFERSKVPLNKWLLANHLMASSKKGVSAHQLHRMLGVTYKTAWFMAHRIREAMRELNPGPLGGEGKYVEVDETYIGGKEHNKHVGKRNSRNIGGRGKEIVFALVERKGRVRSGTVNAVSTKTLRPIMLEQIREATALMSDDAGQYRFMHRDFPKHQVVNHSIREYVRGDAYTNTVEGYFSVLKRGITGTYHHVSPEHLKRYLGEFDFRYNNRSALGIEDDERADLALKGIEGKRLTYRRANVAA